MKTLKNINHSSSKIGIVGASAPACILALYLQKKNYEVILLEKTKIIGGAWANDKKGPKYSNIIYPINSREKKYYKRALNFFRKNGVSFKKDIEKSLFSKKIVKSSSCDLSKLYQIVKNKIQIKTGFKIKSLIECEEKVIVNYKHEFDHIILPSYIEIDKIFIKKNILKRINIPFLRMNNALHVRMVVKNFFKKKLEYKKLQLGPMDRFQIKHLKNSLYQINGRILLDWKKKNHNTIKKNILQTKIFKKILKIDFFKYRSCIRNRKHITILNNNLKKLDRIHHINTFTLIEFFIRNIFNKNLLLKLQS